MRRKADLLDGGIFHRQLDPPVTGSLDDEGGGELGKGRGGTRQSHSLYSEGGRRRG